MVSMMTKHVPHKKIALKRKKSVNLEQRTIISKLFNEAFQLRIFTSSDRVSKLPPSSALFFSFANNLCALSFNSFGCGVFCRTNGVSLSAMPESSENLTECVRDASRSSHASESDDTSSSCPSINHRHESERKRKQSNQSILPLNVNAGTQNDK